MKNKLQNLKNASLNRWRWVEKIIALLGGRIIAMLALALLISMISVVFSDNWIVSIGRQNEVIGNIRTNIIIINHLKESLYKAESAQRGYIFTQQNSYIGAFNQALKEARKNLQKVENLVISNPSGTDNLTERKWLKTISASLEAKAAEMKVTLDLTKSGNIKEAGQVANLEDSMVEMQRFMQYTDALIQNQSSDLNTLIKKRQNTLVLARSSVMLGALVLILLVILVIKQLLKEMVIKSQYQTQVIQENTLYEQKLLQQTKLLRSLALDYQADVEREREKLSRELHDEIGSIFTATKMDIAWIIKKLKDISPEVVEKLKKTSRYIDQGINYQRHIVQELHPSTLSTFGFWPAIQALIEDAAERNQWVLTLNLPEQAIKLNETISLVAYRIVQETLNNANKYAMATAISVHIINDEKYLKIEIEDNGIGLDMKLLNKNTHGLSGMRNRVQGIGGNFEILSELGKGVIVRVLIPLDV